MPKIQTPVRMTRGRHPQWKGERKAVLVRLPLDVAHRLEQQAARRSQSLSDTVGTYITVGIEADEAK